MIVMYTRTFLDPRIAESCVAGSLQNTIGKLKKLYISEYFTKVTMRKH